jgi:hypothetical protein
MNPSNAIGGDFLANASDEHAIEVLQATYARDVEALAEMVKPSFLTGQFTSYRGAFNAGVGRWVADEGHGFEELEALCRTHRRAQSETLARITLAVCSGRAVAVCEDGGPDGSPQRMAAFVLAYDVREHAFHAWGLKRDDYFKHAEDAYDAAHKEPERRASTLECRPSARRPSRRRSGDAA